MATKNIVPRTGSQGQIGTVSKPWKQAIFDTGSFEQISGSILSSGSFGRLKATTFSGDGSKLSGITSGIFQTTGSSENTTNDIQISGSLIVSGTAIDAFKYGNTTWNESVGALSVTGSDFFWKSTGGGFDIYDNSDALMFKIDNKMAVLGTVTGAPPTATAGGLYYSGSDEWFFGYTNEPS